MKALSLSTFAAIAFAVCGCNAEDKAKPVNDTKPKDLSKLSKEELAKQLDKEAFNVCIMGGTERPFANKYWDNHEEGIYVDIISGKPLFSYTRSKNRMPSRAIGKWDIKRATAVVLRRLSAWRNHR